MKKLALILAAAAALATAPTASADSRSFINELEARGFYGPSVGVTVAMGYQVCERLDQGARAVDIAFDVYINSGRSVSAGDAGQFTGIAVRELCPRHIATLTRQINSGTTTAV